MRKRNRLRLCPIIVSVLVFALDGPSSGRAADSDPSIVNDLETATTSGGQQAERFDVWCLLKDPGDA